MGRTIIPALCRKMGEPTPKNDHYIKSERVPIHSHIPYTIIAHNLSYLKKYMMSSTTDHRQIRLVRLAHVYYTHKDLTKASKFLEDFGFHQEKTIHNDKKTIYYRGTGPEPFVYCAREGDVDEFGGAAFVVESPEELEYASQTLPGASKVYELKEAPGEGHCVTFIDPVDGFPFHLVYGQSLAGETRALPQLKYNYVCFWETRLIQERALKKG